MKYTVIDRPNEITNMFPIQIDEGEFAGCQIIYGSVAFPDEDSPTLRFEYEIVNDYNVNEGVRDRFEQVIGDLLVQIIEESLGRNEIIYKGGA